MSQNPKPQSSPSHGLELPDPKTLTKLAKACRSAGITYFKSGSFEFSLSPDYKPTTRNPKATKSTGGTPDPVSEDELSGDALLFWSAQEIPEAEKAAS